MAARPEPSLTQRAFSGALWTTSGWGLTAVVQVAFGIFIARLLGPAILGIYAAALVIIRFSNIFANLGIGPALVQRDQIEPRHVRTGVALSSSLSLALAAMTWLGAPLLASFYRMPELDSAVRALALVFPLRGLAVVPRALLLRRLKFRRTAAIEACAYIVGFGLVGVSLAFADFGLDALIIATVTHAALELALLSWAQPYPLIPGVSWSAAKELLRFGGGDTLAGLLGFLALQGDKLIVGRLLGAAALGLYTRSYSLAATSTRLYAKIASTAFFPLLSRIQTDRARLGRGFRTGLTLNALSLLPLSAVLFVLAPYLIEALLGQEWLEAIAPFRILIVFSFFRSNAKLCGPLMMAAGKVYRLALIQGFFAASVLVGTWFGSRWGIDGAAFAVAGAFVLQSMILLHASLQLTGLSWMEIFGSWLQPLAVALTTGMLTWLLVQGLDSWLSPILVVVTTLLVLSVLLLIALVAVPRLFLNDDSVQALRQVPRLRAFEERLNRKLGRSAN